MKYMKVRFTSRFNGNTDGIVITDVQQQTLTLRKIAFLFPNPSKCMDKDRLQRSKYFDTFGEAFAIDMDQSATADRFLL